MTNEENVKEMMILHGFVMNEEVRIWEKIITKDSGDLHFEVFEEDALYMFKNGSLKLKLKLMGGSNGK